MAFSNALTVNNNLPFVKTNLITLPKFVKESYNQELLKEINEYRMQIADEFQSSANDNSSSVVFKASDGKNYNLKDIILERVNNLAVKIYEQNNKEKQANWFNKTINWFRNKFNIGHNYQEANNLIMNTCNKIDNDIFDIKTLFKDLTGKKYIPKNIEKFLSGEIKLKAETYCEKYTGENVSVEEISVPFFDENWKQTLVKPNSDFVPLNNEEQERYNTLLNALDDDYKQKLEFVLNSGELFNKSSQDNRSILDHLYNILQTPRMSGVNNKNLLKECLDILENPCIITQIAEDIPEDYQEQAIDIVTANSTKKEEREEAKEKLSYRSLGTCTASSLEYDLFTQSSAEFFRLISDLTSEKEVASKTFELSKESDEYKEFISKLDLFKTPYEETEDGIQVSLTLGKNTQFLSQIQNRYKDKNERSIIDIVMQSMIMNLGSRQTYDALSDTRSANEWTQEDGGLIQAEVEYAAKILHNNKIDSFSYMKFNNKGKIIRNDILTKQRDIYKVLSENKNCIVGYCFINPNDMVEGGHEITIIGYTKNLAGKGFFVCQDSDDEYSNPICISEDFLLKRIHHIQSVA